MNIMVRTWHTLTDQTGVIIGQSDVQGAIRLHLSLKVKVRTDLNQSELLGHGLRLEIVPACAVEGNHSFHL